MPAVFEKKTKWRPYWKEDCLETCRDSDRENYLSAKDHAAVVQQQFEAEAKLGAMLELSVEEAQAKYGRNFAIASLGALRKRMAPSAWCMTGHTALR